MGVQKTLMQTPASGSRMNVSLFLHRLPNLSPCIWSWVHSRPAVGLAKILRTCL